VAQGPGLIARRERALLFLPDGPSAAVVERFTNAADDQLVDGLTSQILDDPHESPALVFIEWSDPLGATHIRVIVRGVATVASNLNAMPTLSGADSATWVERQLVHEASTAHIRSGTRADEATDLRDGVVGAGGFELQLTLPSSVEPAGSQRVPQRADRDVRLDRIASLEAAGGDWMEESLRLGAVTSNTKASRSMGDESPSESQGDRPERPRPFEVELPDGTRHRVLGTVALGRQPDERGARSHDAVIVRFDAASTVSRTHLRLHLDGERLLATDCASSGGTVLISAGDPTPVHLQQWTPRVVRDGDRLHLGDASTSLVIHSG